jgi:hypothetical protein
LCILVVFFSKLSATVAPSVVPKSSKLLVIKLLCSKRCHLFLRSKDSFFAKSESLLSHVKSESLLPHVKSESLLPHVKSESLLPHVAIKCIGWLSFYILDQYGILVLTTCPVYKQF